MRSLWQDRPLTREPRLDPDIAKKIRHDSALHREYIRRFQAREPGTEAILIAVNEPFIKRIIRKYGFSTEYTDRLQEGRLALLEGCARFDVNSGLSPLTYVASYVTSYISRAIIDEGQVVRAPAHMYKQGGLQINSRHTFCFSELADKNNEDTGLSFEDSLIDGLPLAEEVLGDGQLEDVLPRLVERLTDGLDEREMVLIKMRFYEEPSKTLGEIGDRLGLSRERTRQIESLILHHCRIQAQKLGAPPGLFTDFRVWVLEALRCMCLADRKAKREVAIG